MSCIQLCDIVRATAGRDTGRLFLVVGFCGNRALLADGKRRKREKPKLKGLRHIEYAGAAPVGSHTISNKEIIRLLAGHRCKAD